MRRAWPLAVGGLGALCVAWGVGFASPTSVARGRRLAEANCARCHTIAGSAESPMAGAPRFSDLERLSGGHGLDDIFADGVLAPHPPMPTFLAQQGAMADLLDFIRSVQDRPADDRRRSGF
jgi:mono/diheme cytochrome c family protein